MLFDGKIDADKALPIFSYSFVDANHATKFLESLKQLEKITAQFDSNVQVAIQWCNSAEIVESTKKNLLFELFKQKINTLIMSRSYIEAVACFRNEMSQFLGSHKNGLKSFFRNQEMPIIIGLCKPKKAR